MSKATMMFSIAMIVIIIWTMISFSIMAPEEACLINVFLGLLILIVIGMYLSDGLFPYGPG